MLIEVVLVVVLFVIPFSFYVLGFLTSSKPRDGFWRSLGRDVLAALRGER